jgi:hypothetical protein
VFSCAAQFGFEYNGDKKWRQSAKSRRNWNTYQHDGDLEVKSIDLLTQADTALIHLSLFVNMWLNLLNTTKNLIIGNQNNPTYKFSNLC